MSGKEKKNCPEPTPGGGGRAGFSSNRNLPLRRNGDVNPNNLNRASDRNSGMNPSLFLPNTRVENNNNFNGSSPNRSSDPRYQYNTARVDYHIAQAWISSAPAAAAKTTTKTALPGQVPTEGDRNPRNRNHGGGAKQTEGPEEFLDEFAESVNSASNRKTNGYNDGQLIRNPFEGLRKNLFSPPSTGMQVRRQQQQQQQTSQPEGNEEVRVDDKLEVRLSWRSENGNARQAARRDTNNNESSYNSWLDLAANQDGLDNQKKFGLCDNSMPSTPPSISDDLIDLSYNEGDSGSINVAGDGKLHAMMIRHHSDVPDSVLHHKDNYDDDGRDEDDDENDNPTDSGGNTLQAVASPRVIAQDASPFLWMRDPQSCVPDEIVLDDDQRATMEDEQLTGDGERPRDIRNTDNRASDRELLFRPPMLPGGPSRPMPIGGDDRQLTPQSWHTPIGSLSNPLKRPKGIIGGSGKRAISGGSRRTRGSVPQSPGSRRSAKSEKYYHSYETNPANSPRPVPPFVVVHSGGSAVVRVTPKKTTVLPLSPPRLARRRSQSEPAVSTGFDALLPDLNGQRPRKPEPRMQDPDEADCGCDGEDVKTKTNIWCRNWGRPVTIAVTTAVFVLALVTVVTSLVARRNHKLEQEKQQQQQRLRPQVAETTLRPRPSLVPTDTPAIFAPSIDNDLVLDASADDDLSILWEDVVKRPYEETRNPAVARPTLPARTYPPTASPERNEEYIAVPTSAPTLLPDNFPDFVPTNLPFLVPRTEAPTALAELFDTDPEPQKIPWNNYVIGLLSVQSPDTFSFFDDHTSPQYLALQWISVDSSRKGGSSAYTMDASLQRFALATVYFALGGADAWVDDASWLSTVVQVCEWKGITCDDSDTAVLSLELGGNGLSGTLPDELKLLRYLQTLSFPGNSIGGTLPPGYSDLYDLEVLDLSGNLLTGSLPKVYGGFGSFELLRVFDLGDNELEGSIPSELGDMPSLETIALCSNALTGTIPSALGSLDELKSLRLGSNRLTGDVPSEVCDAASSIFEASVDCAVGCGCCTGCCDGDDDECC